MWLARSQDSATIVRLLRAIEPRGHGALIRHIDHCGSAAEPAGGAGRSRRLHAGKPRLPQSTRNALRCSSLEGMAGWGASSPSTPGQPVIMQAGPLLEGGHWSWSCCTSPLQPLRLLGTMIPGLLPCVPGKRGLPQLPRVSRGAPRQSYCWSTISTLAPTLERMLLSRCMAFTLSRFAYQPSTPAYLAPCSPLRTRTACARLLHTAPV